MDPKNQPQADEPDDIRAALNAAIDEVEPSEEVPASAPAPAEAPAPAPALAEAPASELPDGFKQEKPAPTPAPAPETGVVDPVAKPPGTWTPAAREKWATIDPSVRQEIWKREREASRAMTMSDQSRRFASEFEKTIQPYLGFIAADRATPLQAVANLMQTAATLRTGTPQQKVELVAEVIKNFGVDLRALDSFLAGQSPEFNPQVALQSEIQRAIAPLLQQNQQFQNMLRERETVETQEIDSEISSFAADPKNEFFEDVRSIMADILEVATRNGQQMGLTDAYQRAIMLHDPVRRVIEGRKQADVTRMAADRANKARGAAVSITPSPEAQIVSTAPGDDIRSAIEFAIAKTEGR